MRCKNTDRLAILVQDLHNNDIDLLLPDINQSESVFSVNYDGEKPRIRYALGAIKNVGEGGVRCDCCRTQ